MSDSHSAAAAGSARASRRASRVAVFLLLCAWAPLAAGEGVAEARSESPGPRRVLILSSFGTDFALFGQVASELRTSLMEEFHEPFDIYEVALEHARAEDDAHQALFVDYLRALFSARPLALVVTLGGPAARFAQQHRKQLFPDVPMLYAAVDVRTLGGRLTLGALDATVPAKLDFGATVAALLHLMPETENLAIVVGSSSHDRYWRSQIAHDLAPFEDRLRLFWTDGLSLDEIRVQVAALPPRSAVLYTLLLIDGRGVPHSQERVLAAVRGATNAPVFGMFTSQVGEGIVGGRLLPVRVTGKRVGEAAVRLLRGESPASVRYPPIEAEALLFDHRELSRWRISERRLPPGSEVRFRAATPWETHRWQIVGGVGLLGLQSGLIAALVLHRARRREAESKVRALHGRLLSSYEQERRRLGRELHDDVSQRLARLAIDGAQVERLGATPEGVETLRQMREELTRLGYDVHALSRRLHPSILDDLGLAEALRAEVESFARERAMGVGIQVDDALGRVSSEAGLCLFRVAQEALRNVHQHARAARVEVRLEPQSGGVGLAVRDDGIGFAPEERKARPGLGLVSMRERLSLVGGRLSIDSAPGRGTTLEAWVPLDEGSA